MRSRIIASKTFAFALACGLSVVAFAATPEETVSKRKGNFREMAGSFKHINDEIRTGSPNRAVVTAAARDVATRSRVVLAMFPKGTGPGTGTTRAMTSIWGKPQDFARMQRALVDAAATLERVAASGDAAALPAAARAVGATCKSCHDQFRADD